MGDPIIEVSQILSVPYHWSYGQQLSKFFKATKKKVILGSRCPRCDVVIVPASNVCSLCYGEITAEPFPMSDHGHIDSYTIVYLPWPGQPTEPPYCMCTVILDGADTNLIHITGEVDLDKIHCDMRVQAVWNSKRNGDLYDVKYFKPEVDPPPKVKIPGKPAKKASAKKTSANKTTAKKTAAGKSTAKKATAKKATTKKAAPKKAVSKAKPTAKKTAAKKTARSKSRKK